MSVILRRRSTMAAGGGVLPIGTTFTFDYTGTVQTVTLDKGYWQLEVYGAQGGYISNSERAGKGGYAIGTLNVESNNLLCYVQVGGSGQSGGTSGGYNGGGERELYDGGGGGTDIRIGQDSLYARVIVAGGGGSDGGTNSTGGYGGGLSGGEGGGADRPDSGGKGGSSISGGDLEGSFGQGGKGYVITGYEERRGGGGGGGWYGGGGSRPGDRTLVKNTKAGGGGSGYVYTSATAESYPAGCLLNSSYYLTNTSMTDGVRTGNGYCIITKV